MRMTCVVAASASSSHVSFLSSSSTLVLMMFLTRLWQVRMLRKRQLVQKYSVNQNGRITILKDKSPRSQPGQQLAKEPWIEIKNIKKLRGVFPTVSFPIEKEGQQEATN